jgi:uncharacterized membrane protein (Fun14 family)
MLLSTFCLSAYSFISHTPTGHWSTVTQCDDDHDKKKKSLDGTWQENPKTNDVNPTENEWLSQLDEYAQFMGRKIQETINTGIPTEISYGFICGYSSGYALKKVGRVVSLGFGLSFALLQSLAYAGYIQFNHEALKKDIMDKYFDVNHDGKVDEQDLQMIYQKTLQVLTYNIPGGAGFGAGFIGGLRAG